MEWIIQNKEWFFSGLGVAIITIIWSLLKRGKSGRIVRQKQKSGSHSNNIQAGGNINK